MKRSILVDQFPYLRKIKTIDLFLFLILLFSIVIITVIYVSSEQYVFFGDFSKYSDKVDRLINKFQISPLKSLEIFSDSLVEDYTDIPCLFILPFRLLFGPSRLTFVLSLSLAYILPFCLITSYISTKIIPIYPRLVFWLSTFLCIVTPTTWISIFRGFPDLAGMSIVVVGMLLYWKNRYLKKRSHILQIAALLSFAVFFRRHFAYSIRALFLTIIICIFIEYFNEKNIYKYLRFSGKKEQSFISKNRFYRFLGVLVNRMTRIGWILIFFLLFSPVLIFKAISINYRVRYASFEVSFPMGMSYYIDAYGWLVFGLAILGFFVGIYSGFLNRPKAIFISLFGCISIVQWCLTSKQLGVHYTTHFTLFVIVGLNALLWTIGSQTKSFNRILLIALQFSILIANFILGLTTVGQNLDGFRKAFAVSSPPMFRHDRAELNRLVKYLQAINPQRKPIYIGASSFTFNFDFLRHWGQSLNPPIKLPILRTAEIDSREYYPLNRLLKAHYVIIANPFQYQILPQEQGVVKTVVDAFNQKWPFAIDYQRLPHKFSLDDQIQVEIYERTRPASFQTILTTLEIMKQDIQRSPAEESYWVALASEQTVEINKNYGGKDVRFESISLDYKQPSSFLYFGALSRESLVSGKLMETTCSGTGTLELRLTTLDAQGNPIQTPLKQLIPTQKSIQKFSFQISSKQPYYLRFDVTAPQQKKHCQVTLDGVTVTPRS